MLLKFTDGTVLRVKSISGNTRNIFKSSRDVLTIDVSPSDASLSRLRTCFKDNPNTSTLYVVDDNGVEQTIGEGYQLLVSINDVWREINSIPGSMEPIQIEEVYVVTLAQLTYQEYQLQGMGVDISSIFKEVESST